MLNVLCKRLVLNVLCCTSCGARHTSVAQSLSLLCGIASNSGTLATAALQRLHDVIHGGALSSSQQAPLQLFPGLEGRGLCLGAYLTAIGWAKHERVCTWWCRLVVPAGAGVGRALPARELEAVRGAADTLAIAAWYLDLFLTRLHLDTCACTVTRVVC